MQGIAQGWLLFELTSSPLYLGLFSSLRMVMLVSFFILGGIMSDRLDRRKVILWIQVVSALTALGLALLVTTHTIQVWHIFVLGAITSTSWAFEQPVRQSLLPQLVSRADLVNALALNAITWNGAGLLGPSLVGLSVPYIGVDGCFYVNVISYLAVIGARVAHERAAARSWRRALQRHSKPTRRLQLCSGETVITDVSHRFGDL